MRGGGGSPLVFLRKKRYKNLGDFVVWFWGFFFLKLCTSIKESDGVSCVFLDHVPPSF